MQGIHNLNLCLFYSKELFSVKELCSVVHDQSFWSIPSSTALSCILSFILCNFQQVHKNQKTTFEFCSSSKLHSLSKLAFTFHYILSCLILAWSGSIWSLSLSMMLKKSWQIVMLQVFLLLSLFVFPQSLIPSLLANWLLSPLLQLKLVVSLTSVSHLSHLNS